MSETEITKEQVKEFLSKLTILELVEFTKELEDLWGVRAQASFVPTSAVGIPATSEPAPKKEEEKTEFDVILKSYPPEKKIAIIKEIRPITNLGLKEAKELVESVPKVIKEAVSKEEAEKIKKQLGDLGGEVEIK